MKLELLKWATTVMACIGLGMSARDLGYKVWLIGAAMFVLGFMHGRTE